MCGIKEILKRLNQSNKACEKDTQPRPAKDFVYFSSIKNCLMILALLMITMAMLVLHDAGDGGGNSGAGASAGGDGAGGSDYSANIN